jgi:phospholipid/cholesterol/gamma-HCH transport system ATP-binding protein
MIRFEHVTKTLSGRAVLNDLSFEIKKGEVFIIVGPSGTGKSVTLKHIVRLMTPDSGKVFIGEDEISSLSGRALEKVRERFGFLFQSGALLGWLSVFDNVALPLREKTRMTEDEIAERVNTVLGLVELGDDGDKYPDEISGGMQKRAGLARAIIRSPEIVLYDEPTSGLDPMTARTIDKLIRKLSDQLGITSVVVSHDLQGSLLIGDRIAMLKNGHFVEISPPKVFVASDQPDVRGFLDAQFIPKTGVVGM